MAYKTSHDPAAQKKKHYDFSKRRVNINQLNSFNLERLYEDGVKISLKKYRDLMDEPSIIRT